MIIITLIMINGKLKVVRWCDVNGTPHRVMALDSFCGNNDTSHRLMSLMDVGHQTAVTVSDTFPPFRCESPLKNRVTVVNARAACHSINFPQPQLLCFFVPRSFSVQARKMLRSSCNPFTSITFAWTCWMVTWCWIITTPSAISKLWFSTWIILH